LNSLRCFISIELDARVKKYIECYIKKLPDDVLFKGIKWVKPENMHITLAFLGETPMDSINQISDVIKLASNSLDPFSINLKGTGFFPNVGEPRVFWIGIEKTPLLYILKEEIDAGLCKLGLNFDKKPFSPHLTLGRFKYSTFQKQFMGGLPYFEASFLAAKISLVKSELLKDGPRYTDIFSCPLKKTV